MQASTCMLTTGKRLIAYQKTRNVTDSDKVFKALADASRRSLVDRLHERSGQTLTKLCEGLDMTRQAVMQHLAVLEDANLVSIQWRGREKLHYFQSGAAAASGGSESSKRESPSTHGPKARQIQCFPTQVQTIRTTNNNINTLIKDD